MEKGADEGKGNEEGEDGNEAPRTLNPAGRPPGTVLFLLLVVVVVVVMECRCPDDESSTIRRRPAFHAAMVVVRGRHSGGGRIGRRKVHNDDMNQAQTMMTAERARDKF
jgi:hypothetical protein